jgi:hypothetical protein
MRLSLGKMLAVAKVQPILIIISLFKKKHFDFLKKKLD